MSGEEIGEPVGMEEIKASPDTRDDKETVNTPPTEPDSNNDDNNINNNDNEEKQVVEEAPVTEDSKEIDNCSTTNNNTSCNDSWKNQMDTDIGDKNSDGDGQPSRIKLDGTTFNQLDRSELWDKWKKQEDYIDYLESQINAESTAPSDLISLKESEEKLKQQLLDASRKENILLMRLTSKEQEVADLLNQNEELRNAQIPSDSQLNSTLLDPALNLMFEKMKKEVSNSREKVEQMQNESAAWKFTTDSHMGKQLMAKCQSLYKENEELGKAIASGRIGKLEGELTLQKDFVEEMKKSQMETDEFLYDLDEEVEGLQATILHLQQQLKEAKSEVEQASAQAMEVDQKPREVAA